MFQIDPLSAWTVSLAGVMCLAGLLAFIFAVAIFRYRLRKEVGLFKRHMRYRPKPPDRRYRLE